MVKKCQNVFCINNSRKGCLANEYKKEQTCKAERAYSELVIAMNEFDKNIIGKSRLLMKWGEIE